jgi:hypothetical protein
MKFFKKNLHHKLRRHNHLSYDIFFYGLYDNNDYNFNYRDISYKEKTLLEIAKQNF